MSINRLYSIWHDRISQLRPGERRTRVRNMAWFICGIFHSGSVHLAKVARKIPFSHPGRKRRLPSATRRLERFVDNPNIRVREWYDPTPPRIGSAISPGRPGPFA
jgi:hypothetical protein